MAADVPISGALRRLWRMCRLVHPVRWALEGIAEFLAPDLCYLCRRPAVPSDGRVPRFCDPLLAETRVSPVPILEVRNHPFCRACLADLRPACGAARIGACGSVSGAGWARTDDGAVFVCRPQAASGAVPEPPSGQPRIESLRVVSPFLMNDAALEIVRCIKFGGRKSVVPLVAGSMAKALADGPAVAADAVLVPVPMFPAARRRRGFNQAELLAGELAALADLDLMPRRLVKRERTRRQSELRGTQRAGNVRDVFAWSGPGLSGRPVIVVDDLVTSGATAASCAGVLKAWGAGTVRVLCFARTA